ncbi:MAG TPA: ribonuclease III [candidate division Zixibacteria bacterium]|nr:ribonuclease III [candidate division Zixibacteria bacterium]MDD4918799.1 ribonuclease III [candidate division Zixibacteria bacterium]MDM7973604.1 ribonuclease III [candidate division Zixibacteria bacterium]HOD65971.1 ribonuclease III [candidate division Zixibacteria bacterium]HOZ07333.1 ribonuclease III [candidate division Zixibacteria bacterium]
MGVWDRLRRFFSPSQAQRRAAAPAAVQQLIGYHFRCPAVLELALTHRSFAHAADQYHLSNERLEFLGDSVLGLVIAERLYQDNPDLREGELTKRKALLVSEATLAEIGVSTGLNRHLLLAPEEDRSGGRERASIVSDAVESIIGAVFLDGGFEAARDVVIRLVYTREPVIATDASRQNFKGELLELVQSRGQGMPQYDVVAETGPDHEKVFRVEVTLNGQTIGSGSGHSKKEAEQRAAEAALLHVRRAAD